jgi:hypothetical protein
MEVVALVYSPECKNYRKLAQKSWGLTDKQMKGMHVHHFPEKCNGGRNIPEHLYVCSPSVHAHCWHNGDWFVEKAAKGGAAGKRESKPKPEKKPLTTEERKELNTRINKERIGKKYPEKSKEIMSNSHKNSEKSKTHISTVNKREWMDPLHPELGVRTIPGLVNMQRRRGYPCDSGSRVKVEI